MRRPQDWLRQAELDLQAATDLRDPGHEWACFLAQQAGEKAVKSAHERTGAEAWGQSVAGLLEELDGVPADVMEARSRSNVTTSPPATPTPTRAGRRETSTPSAMLGSRSRMRSWCSTMSDVAIHRLDDPAAMRALRAYGSELSARPEVWELVLIGSLARGDWSARSDADVVVIVDEAAKRLQDRSPAYAPSRRLGVPVDVFVYTHEERAGWADRFEREVERGVVLYRRH
jgi:HEPN domain-containing protein/predicted nucleotidyltransferase